MDRRPPIPVDMWNNGYVAAAHKESRDVPHRLIHTHGQCAMHNWSPRNHFMMVFQQPYCVYQAGASVIPLFYSPNSVAGPCFPSPITYYGNIYPSMANTNQPIYEQTSERVAILNHQIPREVLPYPQAMHQQFQMSQNEDTRFWQDQRTHAVQDNFGSVNNVARMQETGIRSSPDEQHGNRSVVEDIICSFSQPGIQSTPMIYSASNCEMQNTAIGPERSSSLIRGTHLAHLRPNRRECLNLQNNELHTNGEQWGETRDLGTAAKSLEQEEVSTLNSCHTAVCTFCVMTKRHVAIYTSHTLTDENGKVTCPFQVNHTCPLCHSLGHTSYYCPHSASQSTHQVKKSDEI